MLPTLYTVALELEQDTNDERQGTIKELCQRIADQFSSFTPARARLECLQVGEGEEVGE
jgi:hypothetical protein